MKFSIVIVTYNAGMELNKTVESVLAQSYQEYEIILQDGDSTDGSVENLKSLVSQEQIQIYSEKDHGIYDAMNKAVAHTSGEYLIFMNCGDYFADTDVLMICAEKIKKNPNRGIYYGDIYNRKSATRVPANPKTNDNACYRNIPCHQACFYARNLFEERGYHTIYKVRADYEHFLWCYYKKEIQPFYLGEVIASYEGGGYSETKKNRKLSAKEHKEITAMYMPKKVLFQYRLLMIVTAAPIRRFFAETPCFASMYQQLKKVLYKLRGIR